MNLPSDGEMKGRILHFLDAMDTCITDYRLEDEPAKSVSFTGHMVTINALTMIYFIGAFGAVSSWTLIIAAFVGSLLSVGFILIMSRRLKGMATLLVAGIMIGYICSAITDFVVTFAEDSDIVNLHGWSLGSFSSMSWDNVRIAAILVGVTTLAVFLLFKPTGFLGRKVQEKV